MTGQELIDQQGPRSSVGTSDYAMADRWRGELQKLGYVVRIVVRLRSGGNNGGMGTYRVTWWPKPE